MSKSTLDSDLYQDIYGDEDFGQLDDSADVLDSAEHAGDDDGTKSLDFDAGDANEASETHTDEKESAHSDNKTLTSSQDGRNSLPPKPAVPNSSSSLSYSAQIAQQFSAYQQTPSQERKQRTEIPRQNASSSDGKEDSIFGKKPSEMHDAGKMFIGGLNWDTTDEGLRNYFSQFGKVDACTIMRDASGTSRGFAFLTFEDPASVNAVVAQTHVLDGKTIDPKRAIPREEHLRNARYFVGGLAPSTTAESMKKFFSTYGKVVDATVMLDRETGRSKGFGFVTFEDSTNVDQLVGKMGLILDDKQIEVKMAQPRSQRDQTRNATTGATPMTGNGRADTAGIMTDGSNSLMRPVQNAAGNMLPFMPNQQQQQQQVQNPMSMMYNRPMNQVPMVGNAMPMMNMNPMAMMGMGMNGFNGMGAMGAGGMNMMGNAAAAAAAGGMGGMNAMGAMNNMGGMGNMAAMSTMGNMGNMGNMAAMGNMSGMRLGMGPMGAAANMGTGMGAMTAGGMAGGMGGMGANMGAGMGVGMGGGMNAGLVGSGMMGGGMGGMGMSMMRPMVGMGSAGMGGGIGRMVNTGPGPARGTNRGQHNFHPYAR
ncbi:hypothetical protein AX16_007706 [Volvariella volvacea WC 439]|nr:hypothetical protein AX16_007706 [Volvariella volvacea WC 439]